MPAAGIKGLILAAGLGKRLQPLTLFRAKPAVPFLNRPLIHNSLDLLRAAGIESVVINTHHLPESVEEAAGSFRRAHPESFADFAFSHEPELLGTAGAMVAARRWLSGDTFVVCNGKIYFQGSLEPALRFHHDQGSLVTLVLVPFPKESSYNPVWLDPHHNIAGFGKAFLGVPDVQPFGFTGIHILSQEIFGFVPAGPSETVKDLYPRLIEANLSVRGFVSQDFWCECSTPGRYLAKSLEVLERSGRFNLMEEESSLCSQVVSGACVTIQSGCKIGRSVLWDHVEVGKDSVISNTIVTSGVKIPPDSRIHDSVVTPKTAKSSELSKPLPGANEYRLWPL